MGGAVEPRNGRLALSDRKPGFERPPSQHVILGTYRAAISFEKQPAGLCRHLSISAIKPGTLPLPIVLEMIAKEFGFAEFPPPQGRVWLEEFDPGHEAVNVIELVK